MFRLPSGIRFTVDAQPFFDLVVRVRDDFAFNGGLLFLPEMFLIQHLDHLRRYIRLLWVVPMTADMHTPPDLTRHLKRLPPGWCILDSGHSFERFPDHLDARDRYALDRLWHSPRYQQVLLNFIQLVQNHQIRLLHSSSEHFRFIASCFPPSQTSAETRHVQTTEFQKPTN